MFQNGGDNEPVFAEKMFEIFLSFFFRISLEVMTLNPKCDLVETAQGVAVTVTGVCQVKIMTESRLLKTACEQFLGKTTREVENVVLQTLEGHLRAILGTLTVEEIYKGWDYCM